MGEEREAGRERLDTCAHLYCTPKPHPIPQTWHSQSNIKNTAEEVHYNTKVCEGRWEKRGTVSELLKGEAGTDRTVRLGLVVVKIMGRRSKWGDEKVRGERQMRKLLFLSLEEQERRERYLRKLLQSLKH